MMINTVILFLRDLLPVFILLCYINVLCGKQYRYHGYLVLISISCIFLTMLFFTTAEYASEWLEGMGIEVISAFLLLLMYICLLFSIPLMSFDYQESVKRFYQKYWILSIIGISIFVSLKGSGFLIFFTVYLQQEYNISNVFVGFSVGFGICISLLFNFFLKELKDNKYLILLNILWSLFLAGNFSLVIDYLSQVNIIFTDSPAINKYLSIKLPLIRTLFKH